MVYKRLFCSLYRVKALLEPTALKTRTLAPGFGCLKSEPGARVERVFPAFYLER